LSSEARPAHREPEAAKRHHDTDNEACDRPNSCRLSVDAALQ